MKTVLFFFLTFFSIATFAQKSKTIEIWTKPLTKEVLNAVYYYDENNTLQRINILFMGQDARYQQLIDYFSIFSGTPKEFYSFINAIEKFYNENQPETTTEIQGHTVSLIEIMGSRGLYIYEKDGNAYRSLTLKGISKFKTVFEKWAEKNSIEYK